MAGIGSGTQAESRQELDGRLTGVDRVLAALERALAPVTPVRAALRDAPGGVCASDVLASRSVPSRAQALIDGRAVASCELIGASPLSPAFVTGEPPTVRVGDPVPPGCDSVIDGALVVGDAAPFEVHGATAPGEGVRRPGEDLMNGDVVVRAGARVSTVALLALATAGIGALDLRRPRLRIVAIPSEGDPVTARFVTALAAEEGAAPDMVCAEARDTESIVEALSGAWDAAFLVGGSGVSGDDCSVRALRRTGEAIAHGFALDPGRTGAAGLVGGKPVLCLPGRFDSALAVYLALGRPVLRRLCADASNPAGRKGPLARKIASAVGLSQIALLQFVDDAWAPLGVGVATMSQLIRAHAYILIPEGSEGLAEGTIVAPMLMPGRSRSE
ncbi:MAG: molybdopterin-binding protein [Beijerinckiaceae bacterium]